MTRQLPPLGRLIAGALVAAVLLVTIPGIGAHLAPADAPAPAGAGSLADAIRGRFDAAMELPIPAYRVAIREWEVRGRSYLVRVEVYDLLFGLGARRGYAIVGCWEPGGPLGNGFGGGWADDASALADVRAQFDSVPRECPDTPWADSRWRSILRKGCAPESLPCGVRTGVISDQVSGACPTPAPGAPLADCRWPTKG